MGILDKLNTDGSSLSSFDGVTPPTMPSASPLSNVHDEYSINGTPTIPGYPAPSNLDLDGVTPAKYLDTPPE